MEPSCHKRTSTSESESQAEASKIFRSGELASHSGKILEWLYFLIASADGFTVMYELRAIQGFRAYPDELNMYVPSGVHILCLQIEKSS